MYQNEATRNVRLLSVSEPSRTFLSAPRWRAACCCLTHVFPTQGCEIYSAAFVLFGLDGHALRNIVTLRNVSVASSSSSCPSNVMFDLGPHTIIHCPLGLWVPPAPLVMSPMNFTGCPNKCAAGYYGNETIQTDATCSGKCDGGGQYCPDASVQPLRCPAGTYLPIGVAGLVEASCIPCAPGAYNPDEGGTHCLTCLAGKLSENVSSTECSDCPSGGYCPAKGAASLRQTFTPCPAGTFNPDGGQNSSASCQACATGKANPIPGSSEPTDCRNCSVGFVAGASGAAFCDGCTAGKYQANEGEPACVACEPGSYCPEDASAALPCKEGSYSISTNLTGPTECTLSDKGSFAPTGSTDQTKCSPGTVQPIAGKGVCDKCAAGTYQADEGEQTCVACEPGSYCPEGAGAALPCEKGSHSSATYLTSRSECTETTAGHFAPTGSTQQTPCNPGTVAPRVNMGACELCEPGSYQPDASSTACIPCAVASYCPNRGTTSPTPCPGGTYSNKTGLANKWQCTSVEADPITNKTFYAPTGSRFPEECPESGFVCPGRAADNTNEVSGSKPIPVVSGKTTELETVEMVEFDLELDARSEQFDQQDFVEWLAQELRVSASLISAEVTPIDVRRRLAAERRRLNGTSTLSSGGRGLKLEVTIQVPQELDAGLGDPGGASSATLAERADKLRSLVNNSLGADLGAALGFKFTVSRSAEVVTVKIATQVDCAPGYCTALHQTLHVCMEASLSTAPTRAFLCDRV